LPVRPKASPQGQVQMVDTLPGNAAVPGMAGGFAPVKITSDPAGADVEADGAFVGNTPSTKRLASGKHRITVRQVEPPRHARRRSADPPRGGRFAVGADGEAPLWRFASAAQSILDSHGSTSRVRPESPRVVRRSRYGNLGHCRLSAGCCCPTVAAADSEWPCQ